MANCHGTIPVTAKVDAEARDFLDEEADALGVSRAEILRRVIDHVQTFRTDGTACGACGTELELQL